MLIQSLRRQAVRLPVILAAVLAAVLTLVVSQSRTVRGQSGNVVTTVSAASFEPMVTPESIVAAFGVNLATSTVVASTVPLPTNLAGTTVKVKDSAGAERTAPLFFVAPPQVNYLIPAGTAAGEATITITNSSGVVSTGKVQVKAVAPAIFTANANGQGVPAATLLRVKLNGEQIYEPIAQFDAATNRYRPLPINLGTAGERVFLILSLSGVRNATAASVLIGGKAVTPLYVGAQGSFVGLDQINVELPRDLSGSGLISLSVSANGVVSNQTEIEIAGAACSTCPEITALSATTLLAGQELIITGRNFSATPAENSVRVVGDETQPEAQILEATATRLRVLVPFGASSGPISVRNQLGESKTAAPVTMRTSISGFVQNGQRQPIPGVTVRLSGTSIPPQQTNAEGAFVLPLPDVPVSPLAVLQIDSTSAPGGLPYPVQTVKMQVRASRDNQFNGYIELRQANGPTITVGAGLSGDQSLSALAEWPASPGQPDGVIQSGQVILDIPNNATVRFPNGATSGALTLTVLESGRTPGTLPAGQFSPVIAQITPFGATITPGAKFTFPNPDGYAPNAQLRLYRFDQRTTINGQANPTLGTFIDSGPATVSADGQRIESAANAVTETTYYFASGTRTTVTLIGRVVENNLNRTPVRRSLVNARGQGIFTDGNGGFVIRNVPVNVSSAFAAQLSGEIVVEAGVGEVVIADDRIGVEADFMRPSTRVDRSQQEQVPPVPTGTTVSPDLILSTATSNRPPSIFAPPNLTANAGVTKDVAFSASDPDPGQTVQVTVSGASFATVIKGGGDDFTLRLTPGANDGGNYTLRLMASDGQGGTSTQDISLRVNGASVIADDQAVVTNKNTPKTITLTGSDPSNRPLTFIITSQPSNGRLGGAAPNVVYTPTTDYVGMDSFTFKVRAGQAESNEATVTIQVRGVALTVPGNQSVNAGETLKFTVAVTTGGPDVRPPLKFEVTGRPGSATIIENPASLQFSWMPTFIEAGRYEITFKAMDNSTPPLSDTKTVVIASGALLAKTSGPEGGAIESLLARGPIFFAGTDGGGLVSSTDEGQSWKTIDLGVRSSFASPLGANATHLFAATSAGKLVSADEGRSWTIMTGLSGFLVSDWAFKDNLVFAGGRDGIRVSVNNGQNWIPRGNGLPSSAEIGGFAIAGADIFARTLRTVYRSRDDGRNWGEFSEGLPAPSTVFLNTIAAVGQTVFVGTSKGIFRLGSNESRWVPANEGLPLGSDGQPYIFKLFAQGNNLYASVTSPNIYISSDNGQSWQALEAQLPNVGVNTFAANERKILAGTSEGVFILSDDRRTWTRSIAGITSLGIAHLLSTGTYVTHAILSNIKDGFYSTTNQGQSWSFYGKEFTTQVLTSIATSGRRLFVGTSGDGVFSSMDGGRTWSAFNTGLPEKNIRSIGAGDTLVFAIGGSGDAFVSSSDNPTWTKANISFFPNESITIFAVKGVNIFVGGGAGSLRISNDGGRSWRTVRVAQTDLNIGQLALNETHIFARTFGAGIFVSTTNGLSWEPANTGLNDLYVTSLEISDKAVFAGTLGGVLYEGTLGGAVFGSINQGPRWQAINVPLQDFRVSALALSGDKVLVGTSYREAPEFGGGNSVLALGNNAQNWTPANSGLTNNFTNDLMAQGIGLFMGTRGSGLFRYSDQSRGWMTVNTNLPPNANVQSIVTDGTTLWAGMESPDDGVYRSTDQGASWLPVNAGLNNKAVNRLFINGTTLYAGTEGGVYRSMNNGDNWTLINAGMGTLPVDSFAAQGGTIYAGTDGSGVYRLNSDGVSWTQKSSRLTSQQVRSLGVSGNVLYAGTIGGGICISRNGGESWTAVNNQLPATLNVYAFAVSGRKVYAGSIYGVFVTEDEGQTWKQINAGLLNTYVTGLAVSGEQLFASTASSGVFVSRIPQ